MSNFFRLCPIFFFSTFGPSRLLNFKTQQPCLGYYKPGSPTHYRSRSIKAGSASDHFKSKNLTLTFSFVNFYLDLFRRKLERLKIFADCVFAMKGMRRKKKGFLVIEREFSLLILTRFSETGNSCQCLMQSCVCIEERTLEEGSLDG